MPAPPAKPRRPRRHRPAHDADPLRRLLVKYDDQRQPVCDDHGRPIFWVIDEGGHLRRLVSRLDPLRRELPTGRAFPGDSDGPPADLPPPLKIKPRGRGQPPKVPAGTWEDGLLTEVSECLREAVPGIIGTLRDREYYADDAEFVNGILDRLFRLARRVLGQTPTQELKDDLKRLAFGGIGKRSGTRKRAETAYDITRKLLEERHHLTAPAVRRMLSRKPVAHDFTALVLNYQSERPLLDENGKPKTKKNGRPILVRPPVCDEKGQPILWVPDENGQPGRPYGVLDEHGQPRPYVAGEPLPRRQKKTVRPDVKMIFR